MSKARRGIGAALLFLALFLLTPALLFWALDTAVLNEKVHLRLYERLGSQEAAGLSSEGLSDVNRAIIDYLQGMRANLEVEAEISGVKTRVFNDRELDHMRDVLSLFSLMRTLRTTLAAAALMLIAAVVLIAGRALPVFKIGAWAVCAWLGVLAGIAVFAAMDFSRAFEIFHELLFENDLWLLDPRTDRMIRMMPEAFFSALASRAAVFMAGALALYLGILYGVQRAMRQNVHE